MADMEMQGGAPDLDSARRRIAVARRRAELRGTVAMVRLPADMVERLVDRAAADVRPPAEERPTRKVFAGPYGDAHVTREPGFRHKDTNCRCWGDPSDGDAVEAIDFRDDTSGAYRPSTPLATHYPGDGQGGALTYDELVERLTSRLTRHYERWPGTAVTDPHEAAAHEVLSQLLTAGGGMLRVAADAPDRCPECTCDPALCDPDDDETGECSDGCESCVHGCPLDPACKPCERQAARQAGQCRAGALRDLVNLVDGLLAGRDLADLAPWRVEAIRERLDHARQWLPATGTPEVGRG